MELARITSKGQMTIPKKVRNALGIHQGDLVRFELEGDRAVITRFPSGDDEYLKALEGTLGEWLTEADEEAYRDL